MVALDFLAVVVVESLVYDAPRVRSPVGGIFRPQTYLKKYCKGHLRYILN